MHVRKLIVSAWVDEEEDMDFSQVPVFNPGMDGVQVIPISTENSKSENKSEINTNSVWSMKKESTKTVSTVFELEKRFQDTSLDSIQSVDSVESIESQKNVFQRPKQGKLYDDKTGEFKVTLSQTRKPLEIKLTSKTTRNTSVMMNSNIKQETIEQTITEKSINCKEKSVKQKSVKKLDHFDSVMGNIKELLDPVSHSGSINVSKTVSEESKQDSLNESLPNSTLDSHPVKDSIKMDVNGSNTLDKTSKSLGVTQDLKDSLESSQMKLNYCLPKKPHPMTSLKSVKKTLDKNADSTPSKADLVDSWRRKETLETVSESSLKTNETLVKNPVKSQLKTHIKTHLNSNKQSMNSHMKKRQTTHSTSSTSSFGIERIEKDAKKDKISAIWNKNPQGPLTSKASIQTMISDVDTILAVHNAMDHLDSCEDNPTDEMTLIPLQTCQESDLWNHSLYPSPRKEVVESPCLESLESHSHEKEEEKESQSMESKSRSFIHSRLDSKEISSSSFTSKNQMRFKKKTHFNSNNAPLRFHLQKKH